MTRKKHVWKEALTPPPTCSNCDKAYRGHLVTLDNQRVYYCRLCGVTTPVQPDGTYRAIKEKP